MFATQILIASAFSFLFGELCCIWPYIIAGLLFGLGAAYWLWYRSARALALEAEAENGRIREGMLALKRVAPRVEAGRLLNEEVIKLRRHGDQLTQQIASVSGELELKETDLKKLQGSYDRSQREAQVHESEIKALQGNVSSLTDSLKGKDSEIQTLSDKFAKLEAEANNSREHEKSLKLNFESTKSELLGFKSQVSEKGTALDEAHSKNESLEAEIKTLKNKLIENEAITQSRIKAARDLESKAQRLEDDLQAKSAEIEALEKDAAEKTERLKAQEEASGETANQILAFQSKLESAEGELGKLSLTQQELESRDKELTRLQADVDAVSGKLEGRDRQLQSLRSEVEGAQATASQAEEALAKHQQASERAEESLRQHEATIAKLEEGKTTQAQALAQTERNLAELQSAKASAETGLKQKEAALAELEMKNASQKSRLEESEKSLAELQSAKASAETALERNEAAVATLEKENASQKVRLSDTKKTIGELTNQLRESHSDKESATLALNRLQSDASSGTDDTDRLRRDVDKLNAELAQAESSLKTERRDSQNAQREAARLSSKLAELEKREEIRQQAGRESTTPRSDKRSAKGSSKFGSSAAAALPLSLASFQGEDVDVDQKLGVVYRSRPDQTDDLKRISGVGPKLESKLHDFGVYRYKQVALWSPEHEEEFASQLSFKDRVRRDQWRAQASKLHYGATGEDLGIRFEDRDGAENAPIKHSELGLLYQKRPDVVDDLKDISGVAETLEGKLHEEGVYRYKQVALWDDAQVQAFSSRLNFKDRVDREGWRPQAARLHKTHYGEELGVPMDVSSPSARRHQQLSMQLFADEEVGSDERLGITYRKRPQRVDDLKRISGVAETLEGKLNKDGVYRFKQIALWDQEQIDEFSNRLSFKDRIGREEWTRQAANLHFENYGEDLEPYMVVRSQDEPSEKSDSRINEDDGDAALAEHHDTLGLIYRERPSNADDLKKIKGVANAFEGKLHRFGVYRFEQIARWNPSQVDAFSDQLDFKGRIEREEWIRQARELHLESTDNESIERDVRLD